MIHEKAVERVKANVRQGFAGGFQHLDAFGDGEERVLVRVEQDGDDELVEDLAATSDEHAVPDTRTRWTSSSSRTIAVCGSRCRARRGRGSKRRRATPSRTVSLSRSRGTTSSRLSRAASTQAVRYTTSASKRRLIISRQSWTKRSIRTICPSFREFTAPAMLM